MRSAALMVSLVTFGLPSQLLAQAFAPEFQAGFGYARLFDANGYSFSAALDQPLSSGRSTVRQALGGGFWYAHTGVASVPDTPEVGRDLFGLGLRYSLGFLNNASFRPFVAVPLQVLHSQVSDNRPTADLLAGALSGVPQAPPPPPVEDQIGGEWGWGTGLEAGLRLIASERVGVQTSVQVLYQDIYGSDSRNGGWNWYAALSYAFGGSDH
ncbi:MAG: hypothetical protein ACJ8A6_11330 [Gemmatimonadales bacterium]